MLLNRRSFFKFSATIMGAASLSGVYAWQIEPYWVEYTRYEMAISELPSHFQGSTLIQLSDLHVGDRFDYSYQKKIFEVVQSMNPDIVVYTGDYITYQSERQYDQLAKLFKHAPLGKRGTFAVLGNHDYGFHWSNLKVADTVSSILDDSHIKVLRDESIELDGFRIVGLEDYWGMKFNSQNVRKILSNKTAQLVLCHNPDALDEPVWDNYKGWVLCGHTHGGQCKPPFLPPPILPVKNKRYTSGLIPLEDGRKIYINRALGHLWPVRFNVRPEVTIFTLRSV